MTERAETMNVNGFTIEHRTEHDPEQHHGPRIEPRFVVVRKNFEKGFATLEEAQEYARDQPSDEAVEAVLNDHEQGNDA